MGKVRREKLRRRTNTDIEAKDEGITRREKERKGIKNSYGKGGEGEREDKDDTKRKELGRRRRKKGDYIRGRRKEKRGDRTKI